MFNLTPVLKEIEKTLRDSPRPEIALFQQYQFASPEVKNKIVLAMIGKLIELDKRASSQS